MLSTAQATAKYGKPNETGAGYLTTIVPDTGVTLRSSGGKTKIAAQYGIATLIKRGADEWYLAGDITT